MGHIADLKPSAGASDATLVKGQLSKTDDSLQWILYTNENYVAW